MAYSIFPAEIWKMIMDRVEDPKDKMSLSDTCTQLFYQFEEFKSGWALAQVIKLPLFLDEIGLRENLRKLRECNRDAKNSVEEVYREIRQLKQWHLDLEAPLPTTSEDWESPEFPLRYEASEDLEAPSLVAAGHLNGDTYLDTPDWMEMWIKENENRPNHSSPFPGKSLYFRFDDTLLALEDPPHLNRPTNWDGEVPDSILDPLFIYNFDRGLDFCRQIITKHGHHLHHLKINMAPFYLPGSFQKFWQTVAQILELVPNLKGLVFHGEVITRPPYQRAVALPAGDFETVALTGDYNPLTTALFQKYAKLAKRLILDIKGFTYNHVRGIEGPPSFATRELVLMDSSLPSVDTHRDFLLQQLPMCDLSKVVKLVVEWRLSKPSFFLQLLQIPVFGQLKFLELTADPDPEPALVQIQHEAWAVPITVEYLIMPFVREIQYDFWLINFTLLKQLTLSCSEETIPDNRLFILENLAPSFSNSIRGGFLENHFFWNDMESLVTVRVEWDDGVDEYERVAPQAPRRIA